MQTQKYKEEVFELRDYSKDVSNFYKKVTNTDLGKELPKIQVLLTSQIEEDLAGFQQDNIAISKKLEDYGRKVVDGVAYHELFHWALWKSGLESNFEGRFYIQFYIDHGYNFAVPLRLLLIKDLPQYSAKINSMEEGTAEFFAATLISKNENEIPKNIFYSYFYENPSTVFQILLNSIFYKRAKKAIKEVYTTYQKFNGLQPAAIDKSLKK
jgi:hypothetical protein